MNKLFFTFMIRETVSIQKEYHNIISKN
jgi:hypothetical protein